MKGAPKGALVVSPHSVNCECLTTFTVNLAVYIAFVSSARTSELLNSTISIFQYALYLCPHYFLSPEPNILLYAGIAVGVGLFLVIVIIVTILCAKRMRQRDQASLGRY